MQDNDEERNVNVWDNNPKNIIKQQIKELQLLNIELDKRLTDQGHTIRKKNEELEQLTRYADNMNKLNKEISEKMARREKEFFAQETIEKGKAQVKMMEALVSLSECAAKALIASFGVDPRTMQIFPGKMIGRRHDED